MKKLTTPLLIIAMTAMLAACGKDSTSKNITQNNQCGLNSFWNGTTCIPGQGGGAGNVITHRVAFADGSTSFQMGSDPYGVPMVHPGGLRIKNQAGYQAFLKDAMGICDRNVWGYSSGLYNCSTWASGKLYISFNVGPDLLPAVTFTAYPPQQMAYYGINIGINAGGAAYNPLILSNGNTFNLINNSQGFEIRANGAWGTAAGRYLIQVMVDKGSLNDSQFNYKLAYKLNNANVVFAEGIFKRTQ